MSLRCDVNGKVTLRVGYIVYMVGAELFSTGDGKPFCGICDDCSSPGDEPHVRHFVTKSKTATTNTRTSLLVA